MWKYQFLFLFLCLTIPVPCSAAEEKIHILDCNILFIEMDYKLINKLYIYEIYGYHKNIIYYFDVGKGKQEIPSSFSSSSLQAYIRYELSNSTHVYLDYPAFSISFDIEILVISNNGSSATLKMTTFYNKNKNCFFKDYFDIEVDIVDGYILSIKPYPTSTEIDQVYIYKKSELKKNLIYYFNKKDITNNFINRVVINGELSNSTFIVLIKPGKDPYFKIDLDTFAHGIMFSKEVILFYNKDKDYFERVMETMKFYPEIDSNNNLIIIPDYEIRIIDILYIYDMSKSNVRDLIYFCQSKTKPLRSGKIIDINSSNATYIKLIRGRNAFYKIEIIAVCNGISSQIQTELAYDSTTDRYALSNIAKIHEVILDPIEPIVGQGLTVTVKYGLQHKHFLNRLLFQSETAAADTNNYRTTICGLWKETKFALEDVKCFNNTIWSQRVKTQFNSISKSIYFSEVLPIDNNYTFSWYMRTISSEDNWERITDLHDFFIKTKDVDETKPNKRNTSLKLSATLEFIILLIIGNFIIFFLWKSCRQLTTYNS